MKSLKFLALLSFLAISTFIISSCDDTDPCEACGEGQTCVEGKCVTNTVDPCAACSADQTCKDGKCVTNAVDKCEGVTCPPGFTCNDGTCVDTDAYGERTVSGTITSDVTWSADTIYYLSNKVVVQNGATLTIEPGTIIKGLPGEKSLASALVVATGAKIMAVGTADKPIIFTSSKDDISQGQTKGTKLTQGDYGLWGGLIVLGKAPVSAKGTDTNAQIEGVPADIDNTTYGGTDAADNSGMIKYVSIRHGGIAVSDGNEINGLTLGGVGSGTEIENVEVISNLDDGIEFFGGSVNVKNAVVAYCGDDALDLDQNYDGTIENAIVVQETIGDEALEFDGPENSTNKDGMFKLMNSTFISKGKGTGADLKSKAQGTIDGCVWTGYTKNIKVAASYSENCTKVKTDAYDHLTAGTPTLVIKNSEIVSSTLKINEVVSVYTKSEDESQPKDANGDYPKCTLNTAYNTNANNAVAADANGNKVVTTATKGADASVFGWTWTKANGGF